MHKIKEWTKLLWIGFLVFLLFDIGVGLYVFVFSKNTTQQLNSTQATKTVSISPSPNPSNSNPQNATPTKITVTTNDPHIKIVSIDQTTLYDAFKRLYFFEINTTNKHAFTQKISDNKYSRSVKPITNLNIILSESNSNNQTAGNNYVENYNGLSQTDKLTVYIDSSQIAKLSSSELSKLVWQRIVYTIAANSSELAYSFASSTDTQGHNKSLTDYVNDMVNYYTDQIIVDRI